MPMVEVKEIPITALTVATAQDERFGGYIESMLIQNDCPFAVNILGHDGRRIAHVLAYDILPWWAGDRDYNSLRIYGEAPSAAADITVGNVLYIHYKLKRKA